MPEQFSKLIGVTQVDMLQAHYLTGNLHFSGISFSNVFVFKKNSIDVIPKGHREYFFFLGVRTCGRLLFSYYEMDISHFTQLMTSLEGFHICTIEYMNIYLYVHTIWQIQTWVEFVSHNSTLSLTIQKYLRSSLLLS